MVDKGVSAGRRGGETSRVWHHWARDERVAVIGAPGLDARRCRHRTVTIRQALEGAVKGRYRAGRRVLTPLYWQVGSVVDRFR